MSHFSNIKTQIRHLPSLKSALTDLGLEWKSENRTIQGYQNKTHEAAIVINQDNGYDVGFSWNGQEYELVADLEYWKQPWTVNGFLNRVTQRYAYHTVVNESSKSGFQIAQEEKNTDGSVRLVLQRWRP